MTEPSLLHWTAEDWYNYFNQNKSKDQLFMELKILLERYDFIKTAFRRKEHQPLVNDILDNLSNQITATLAKIQTDNLFKREQ